MDVNAHVNLGRECGRSPEVGVFLGGNTQMLQKDALTSPGGTSLCVQVCAYMLEMSLGEL